MIRGDRVTPMAPDPLRMAAILSLTGMYCSTHMIALAYIDPIPKPEKGYIYVAIFVLSENKYKNERGNLKLNIYSSKVWLWIPKNPYATVMTVSSCSPYTIIAVFATNPRPKLNITMWVGLNFTAKNMANILGKKTADDYFLNCNCTFHILGIVPSPGTGKGEEVDAEKVSSLRLTEVEFAFDQEGWHVTDDGKLGADVDGEQYHHGDKKEDLARNCGLEKIIIQ